MYRGDESFAIHGIKPYNLHVRTLSKEQWKAGLAKTKHSHSKVISQTSPSIL